MIKRIFIKFNIAIRQLLTPRLQIHQNCRVSFRSTISTRKGSIVIGRNSVIHKGTIIDTYNGNIKIGDNFSLNPFSIIYGHGGVLIGDNVLIAAHVVIVSANHRFDLIDSPIRNQGETRQGIIIEDDVWIGAGAKILDGSVIKKGCVIGANAVFRGTSEPFGVYAGVPAKKIKTRIKNQKYE